MFGVELVGFACIGVRYDTDRVLTGKFCIEGYLLSVNYHSTIIRSLDLSLTKDCVVFERNQINICTGTETEADTNLT